MTALPEETRIAGIGHVKLRVRNLQDSVRFYREVFGLRCQETSPRLENQCVCVGVPAAGRELFGVVLSEGFPAGAQLAGLDHVGMRVSTEQDVRDIYARALEFGHRVTRPRIYNGHYQVFVFDPDGYKLEVFLDRCTTAGQGENHGIPPGSSSGDRLGQERQGSPAT